jgi:sec-independent protein translocase protein TatA
MGHIEIMDTVCASFAFIDGLGAPEMALIFVLVLVLFGGQKLPEFARGLGKSIREFKKAAAGVEEEFKRALEEDERKNATPKIAAPTTPALPAAAATTYADHGGPDPYIPTYDEYGNEVPPETPAQPVATVTPADPTPSPENTILPPTPVTPVVTENPPPPQSTPVPASPSPAVNPAPPSPTGAP